MHEADIVKAVRREIQRRGGKALKLHGDMFSEKGTPDMLTVYKGFVGMFEIKQPGEFPTPLQDKRMADWRFAGAMSTTITSVEDIRSLYLDYVDSLYERVRAKAGYSFPQSPDIAIDLLCEALDK